MLGLPAAPFPSGSDLKKRKRMLALQNGETFAAEGEMGNYVIGSNVSHGEDIDMNVIAAPLGDEHIVTAGPDVQACLDK